MENKEFSQENNAWDLSQKHHKSLNSSADLNFENISAHKPPNYITIKLNNSPHEINSRHKDPVIMNNSINIDENEALVVDSKSLKINE